MINYKSIDETVSTVGKVAESIIENMAVGSRFTTKEFVDQVVEETHVAVAVAAGVTALVVNNCDSVKPRAGRGGGIFKVATPAVVTQDLNADMGEDDDMEEAH